MENIKMSFISLQRILRIACKANHIDQYEINTLRYLFDQCDQEQKEFLLKKYGERLKFLMNSTMRFNKLM